jgi:hypothetical protein
MHDGLDSCAVFVIKRICNQEFKKLSHLIRLCETLQILLFSLVLVFLCLISRQTIKGDLIRLTHFFPLGFSIFTNCTVCPVSNVLNWTCRRNQHIQISVPKSAYPNTAYPNQHTKMRNTEKCGLICVPFWVGGGVELTTVACSGRRPCPPRSASN